MIIPDYSGLGYSARMTVKGGHLIEGVNQAYKTPYQLPFNGMAVSLAKSSTYDADAVPTVGVVVPCKTGEKPFGWIFISTQEHSRLPGTPTAYLPLTANLDQTDSEGIKYCSDVEKWAVTTVAPYQPSEGVGMPIAAGQKFAVGDEIAVSNGGFARKASSTQTVIGYALYEADNTAGSNGDVCVWLSVNHQYVK